MNFKIKLLGKKIAAQDTLTFTFEKPENFKYRAGEYVFLTLPSLNYPDNRGNSRHFTLSSSSTEPFLEITMRMRESGFKKTLDEFPIGTLLDVQDAPDTFFLDKEPGNPQIFIAGGMGISPFRSIIKSFSDRNITTPIHLIYSNKTPEDIVFKEEFDELSKNKKHLNITYTVTRPEKSKQKWDGLKGRISASLIKKLTAEYESPTFWLCGPPDMVTSMEKILEDLGVPQASINVEKFTGY